MKYLRMYLDKRLTLQRHVLHLSTKTDAAIRLLYPLINRKSVLSDAAKVSIYRIYIRPILTYCPPLTLEMKKTNYKKLEIIQNKCLRLCLNISWESRTKIPDLERRANTPNLKNFAEKLKTTFVEKCKVSENRNIRHLAENLD